MEEEIKVSKSYSLRPSQIAWLRQQALNESTSEKIVSASALLERIIDEAMAKTADSPTKQKKSARALEIAVVI